MAGGRAFRQEQRGVAAGMAAALATTVIVLGATALAWPGEALPFPDRLQLTLRADLIVIVWLAAAIGNVARLRFFSEQDIGGSSAQDASAKIRVAGAILQNTFEQAVLAIVTHLIVAATFARAGTAIIMLACLFAAGRLLFWIGYRKGARARAFGFALTFYPSVLALLAAAVAMVLGVAT